MEKQVLRDIRIRHTRIESVQTLFANNFVLQHSQHDEYHLSCFEIVPPVIISEDEDDAARQLEDITSIEARCVARLVFSRERLKELGEIIAKHLGQEGGNSKKAKKHAG